MIYKILAIIFLSLLALSVLCVSIGFCLTLNHSKNEQTREKINKLGWLLISITVAIVCIALLVGFSAIVIFVIQQ